MGYQQHCDLAVSETWVYPSNGNLFIRVLGYCMFRERLKSDTWDIWDITTHGYTAKGEWDIYYNKCPQDISNIIIMYCTWGVNLACNRDIIRRQEYNSDAITLTLMGT